MIKMFRTAFIYILIFFLGVFFGLIFRESNKEQIVNEDKVIYKDQVIAKPTDKIETIEPYRISLNGIELLSPSLEKSFLGYSERTNRKYVSPFIVYQDVVYVPLNYFPEIIGQYNIDRKNKKIQIGNSYEQIDPENIYEIANIITKEFERITRVNRIENQELDNYINVLSNYVATENIESIINFYYEKDQNGYSRLDDTGWYFKPFPVYSESNGNQTVYFTDNVAVIQALVSNFEEAEDGGREYRLKVVKNIEGKWKLVSEFEKSFVDGPFDKEEITNSLIDSEVDVMEEGFIK